MKCHECSNRVVHCVCFWMSVGMCYHEAFSSFSPRALVTHMPKEDDEYNMIMKENICFYFVSIYFVYFYLMYFSWPLLTS